MSIGIDAHSVPGIGNHDNARNDDGKSEYLSLERRPGSLSLLAKLAPRYNILRLGHNVDRGIFVSVGLTARCFGFSFKHFKLLV